MRHLYAGIASILRGSCKGSASDPLSITLPTRHHLKGWVKNTSAGVDIEVDGEKEALDLFLQQLRDRSSTSFPHRRILRFVPTRKRIPLLGDSPLGSRGRRVPADLPGCRYLPGLSARAI